MRAGARTVVEISSSHVKVVRSVRSSAQGKISFCEVSDITGASDAEIIVRLKEILRRGKISRGTEIVGVIPRQDAIIKFLNLPAFDPKEIKQMVELQAFQQVPYSRGEAVFDYTTVSQGGLGYSKVMSVIVPQDIFLRYWSIYEKAGLVPRQITISSMGIAAWLGFGTGSSHVNAVMDVDEEGSEICICEGEKLLTSRALHVSTQDMEGSGVSELVQQLELTLSGYEKERIGTLVVKVIFLISSEYGEKCMQEGRRFLQQAFENIRSIDNMPVYKTLVWPKKVLEGKVSVTAVCGISLNDRPTAIDLIAPEISQLQARRALVHGAIRAGVLALAALFLFSFVASLPLLRKNARLEVQEQELRGLKTGVAKVQKKAERIEAVETILFRRIRLSGVIKELYGLIPENMVLVSLNISADQKMTIQGYSVDRNMVDTLQKAMGQAVSFKDVKLENINKKVTQSGEVNYFEITCRIAGAYDNAQ